MQIWSLQMLTKKQIEIFESLQNDDTQSSWIKKQSKLILENKDIIKHCELELHFDQPYSRWMTITLKTHDKPIVELTPESTKIQLNNTIYTYKLSELHDSQLETHE